MLDAKHTRHVAPHMYFTVSVGFQNIPNKAATGEKDKTYSLLLIDTVHVGENGEATVLTPYKVKEDDFNFEVRANWNSLHLGKHCCDTIGLW